MHNHFIVQNQVAAKELSDNYFSVQSDQKT